MIEDRDFGRLEARVERLEGLRQRAARHAAADRRAGSWPASGYLSQAQAMDDRLDRIEAGQVRIEQKLGVHAMTATMLEESAS